MFVYVDEPVEHFRREFSTRRAKPPAFDAKCEIGDADPQSAKLSFDYSAP